ncbi:hypothetical protein AJ80_06144 [Polytolypa hystricis UAMH7299]|uniref:Kynurenine 3-monooxygenase n=1 Tax=Polytolypa hystricis (strain UAMH7299) TaxID=1447883 RepID=A0A2B7XY53_POLH7|nr:hypothetical protein AJ80_06144 [Polytolypa hystricis UAMH7299]
MATREKSQKVVIVGAGPVGSLAALYAASRGDDVELYELRGDLRDPSVSPLNFSKSINLAISERGINSMRCSNRPGFVEAVLKQSIPMYGRMIHGKNPMGKVWEEPQAYDVHGRFINAIDRTALNGVLLDELEKTPNVKLFFNHKLTGADFRNKKAWFEREDPNDPNMGAFKATSDNEDDDKTINVSRAPEVEVPFDFLIGADGAHSAARYHLMKYTRMDYKQEYIDVVWVELQIPPSEETNDFRISPNHLHIWPGREFMFIALPSPDKSFVCTLFAPASHFVALDRSPENLLEFFNTHFPGVCPELISPEALKQQFQTNPHLPIISIKCTPHHYESSAVILGDAAHAMLPFYGQGLNAGMEDVRILFEMLDSHGVYDNDTTTPGKPATEIATARAAALTAYSRERTPDAYAIIDLSYRNYLEMRWGVKSPLYRLRKAVEETLDAYVPRLGWATQYARVSFSNAPYSEVETATQRQGQILSRALTGLVFAVAGVSGMWLWRWHRARDLGGLMVRIRDVFGW